MCYLAKLPNSEKMVLTKPILVFVVIQKMILFSWQVFQIMKIGFMIKNWKKTKLVEKANINYSADLKNKIEASVELTLIA